MSIETQSAHITPAGGNVFADLGFGSQEAAMLKEKSEQLILKKLRKPGLASSTGYDESDHFRGVTKMTEVGKTNHAQH
jgi:hypothetical protein